MLYRLLRAVAGIALRWYYRGLEIAGAERIPGEGPILVAGNHPNALIDALVIGRVVPRRLLLTAKATLFARPLLAAFLARAGAVPLRRAADEAGRPDPARNAAAFAAVLDALAAGGAVLLFPEGRSHDEPQLSPLRTGLARIALEARDGRGVRGLSIVPVGLTFEDKAAPRTRVLVEVGEPLALDAWRPAPGEGGDVEALTREVDRRLRSVTLNFESAAAQRRVLGLGGALAAVLDEPRPLGRARPPLGLVAALARRIEDARRTVEAAPAGGGPAAAPSPAALRAVRFAERLEALEATAGGAGVDLAEATISVSVRPAAWFAVRETVLTVLGAPLALWGRVNHWLPFRAALAFGRRATNREDPAMRTVVAGAALVLVFYGAQAALVGALAGTLWAAAYVLTLPASAGWDLRGQDRREDAARRIRAYFALRRDPALRRALQAEIAALREEAAALDALLPQARASPRGDGVLDDPGRRT